MQVTARATSIDAEVLDQEIWISERRLYMFALYHMAYSSYSLSYERGNQTIKIKLQIS